jgi:hypothetical protein
LFYNLEEVEQSPLEEMLYFSELNDSEANSKLPIDDEKSVDSNQD